MGHLSPQVVLERIDLLRRGLSDEEIAKRQGVKRQAIYLWRWRYEARARNHPGSGATDPDKAPTLDLPPKASPSDVDRGWRQRAEAAQREVKSLREELHRLACECNAVVEASKKRYNAVLIDLSMHRPVAPPPPTPAPPAPRPTPKPPPPTMERVELQILDALRDRGGVAPKRELERLTHPSTVRRGLRFLRARGLVRVVMNFSGGKHTRVELVNRAPNQV